MASGQPYIKSDQTENSTVSLMLVEALASPALNVHRQHLNSAQINIVRLCEAFWTQGRFWGNVAVSSLLIPMLGMGMGGGSGSLIKVKKKPGRRFLPVSPKALRWLEANRNTQSSESVEKLAIRLGASVWQLRQAFSRYNIEKKGTRSKGATKVNALKRVEKEISTLKQKGIDVLPEGIREAAQNRGLTVDEFSKILNRNDMKTKGSAGVPRPTQKGELFQRLIESDQTARMTIPQIMAHTGYTDSTVRKKLKNAQRTFRAEPRNNLAVPSALPPVAANPAKMSDPSQTRAERIVSVFHAKHGRGTIIEVDRVYRSVKIQFSEGIRWFSGKTAESLLRKLNIPFMVIFLIARHENCWSINDARSARLSITTAA